MFDRGSSYRALRAVSLLLVGALVSTGLAFIIQIVLARALTPARYGLFSAALATVTLLAPIAGFGVQGFLLKVFGAEGWAAMRWLPASFVYSTLSALGAILLLGLWAVCGPHDTMTQRLLLSLLPVTASLMVIGLVSTKLQLEERYTALSVWQSLPNVARLLLILLATTVATLPLLDMVATIYSLVALGITAVGFVQLKAMVNEQFVLKGHPTLASIGAKRSVAARANVLQVAQEAWPFGLGGVFHLIYFQSAVILLRYLVGSETAGIYNVAFIVMAAVYLIPNIIYQKYLLPKTHRWAYHDYGKFLHVYRVGNGVMLLSGVIATLLILILAPSLIRILFGEAYRGAVSLLSILAFCIPLRFLASSVGSTLVTKEHMRRKTVYMGIVAIVNVPLNLLLISLYAARGAAFATILSEIVMIALYLLAVRRHVFGQDAWRGWTLRYKK